MYAHQGASSRVNRSLQLDGLRGLGCIGVLFGHAHYSDYTEWLWTLVDLFFVLSGFLISRLLLRGLQDRSFSLRNFMIHRVLRVWPVYYLTLSFCLSVLVLNYLVTGSWVHTNGLASSPFFMQFTYLYLEPGLQGRAGDFIPWFHHSWSLAVEEQFYVLLPLLLLIFRRSMAFFVCLMFVCVVAAVYFRFVGANYVLLVARMDGLAIGVLLGCYWVYVEEWSRLPRLKIRKSYGVLTLAFSAALVGFYFLAPALEDHLFSGARVWQYAAGLLGFNLCYGVLVLSLCKNWLPWLSRFMSWRPFVWFGSISYALYMFHLPVRGLLLQFEGASSIAEASSLVQLAYFVVSVVLAAMSKKLIEEPVLRARRFFPLYKKFHVAHPVAGVAA